MPCAPAILGSTYHRRMAWRKPVVWIAACGATVSALMLSSCAGSSSGSPSVADTPPAPSTEFTSTTIPDNQSGAQLRWVLSSVADAPLSLQAMESHFNAAFVAKFPVARINAFFARFPVPGKLVGVCRRDRSVLS